MSTSKNTVQLLDGGFSSQLSKNLNKEAEFTNHPLWCARFLLTDPEAVINTHRDYIKAGADIVTTNTYQASVDGFQKYLELSSSKSYQLIQEAVRFVKTAISLENAECPLKRKVAIAGSVGSFGACLHDGSEYNGNYTQNFSLDLIKTWHRPRMAALVEAGVDLLAIETIPSLAEAEIIVSLLREFPNVKAWVSFSCKDNKHTVANDELKDVAVKLCSLNSDQLIAIGVNCLHPSLVSSLIKSINSSAVKLPTIAYPNSGEYYNTAKKSWEKDESSPPVHSYVPQWLDEGISILGGCCRTTASDIKLFRSYLDDFHLKDAKSD